MLDARRNSGSWERYNAGLEGTAWYLLRIHQTFSHRLPGSRSTELLGEAVGEILAGDAYRRLVPAGLTSEPGKVQAAMHLPSRSLAAAKIAWIHAASTIMVPLSMVQLNKGDVSNKEHDKLGRNKDGR